MRNGFRRIVMILLIMLAMGSIFNSRVSATTWTGSCGTNAVWTLADGILTISGTGTMKNYTVAKPAPWDSQREEILSVIIDEGITSIGNYAFNGCSNLASIDIAASVTKIGNSAISSGFHCSFLDCTSLREITIPEKVSVIAYSTFYGCTNLTAIHVAPDNDTYSSVDGVLYNHDKTQLRCYPAGKSGGVTVPSTVTAIAPYAFATCSGLTEITMPSALISIGNYAFDDCKGLCRVTFTGNAPDIGTYSFMGVTADVYLPVSDNSWTIEKLKPYGGTLTWHAGSGACGDDVNWDLTYVDGVATLTISGTGDMADYDEDSIPWKEYLANIGSFQVREGVTSVGAGALVGASNLTTVVLADSVTSIGNSAFSGAANLAEIVIPAGVTDIGGDAFRDCTNLQSVEFLGNGPIIASNAFAGTTCHASYLVAKSGWTADKLVNYGGNITWKGICISHSEKSLPAVAPNCTASGLTEGAFCSLCGEVLTAQEVIPATGHYAMGRDQIMVPADSLEADCTNAVACTLCGEVIKEALGHHWDDGRETIPPTEISEGEMTYTCQRCNETKTEILPVVKHVHRYGADMTEPTCTERGYTTNTCTCGDSYVDGYINALGHDMGQWGTTREATCIQKGERQRDCSRCDYFETEEIAATGHDYESVITTPTCTEKGYTTHSCACGENYVDSYVDALGHEMDDWIIIKDATCTQKGERQRDCSRCDYSETEETGIIDHDYESVITMPTCREKGYTTHTCACGDNYVDSYVDALSHNYSNGTCGTCGEEDPDYGDSKPQGNVIRLAGSHRYETALKVADQLKKVLNVQKFDAVIIASGNNFADALAGSYLSAVKQAPILLSFGGGGKYAYLDTNNIDYIKANLKSGGTVYLLGGENAVPKLYDDELSGFTVKRLGGKDRFETNLMILREAGVKPGQEILVCTATEYADALSASATGQPILLVFNQKGELYGDQPDFLEFLGGQNDFCIIGGTNAVGMKLEKALSSYGKVTRLAGTDRLNTSVMVAEKYFKDADSAVVAYGWNYPDGLCGGSLAYAMKAPLLLTYSAPKYYAIAADYTTRHGINSGIILGGETLITEETAKAIF